jgi:hypothetical protein
MANRPESGATPEGGGNDRECPNFGKAGIPPELSPLAMIAAIVF